MKELLDKLKWDERYDFSKVTVWYVSRGEINDMGYVKGDDIKEIGKYFLETTKGHIPYHRILKIEYEGKEVGRGNVKP